MARQSGPNWAKIFAVTAAVVGISAAAAYYVRRMKAQAKSVDRLIDDAVNFCRTKADELDKIVSEVSAS
ncbi:MAG: hypothetical protein AKCLJLPJ_02096 [Fimbriimonadales bacterium]|nr:MAG: hypothetical protein EDM73_06195 [Armatimonadota bacterium]MBV6504001.1 hypothetical protein [Fimbriimonadales bacterium]MCE7900011.1 hypothetical protein [Armatimonadetes bacterium ATM1]MDL1929141.1 hypothetical protein [Fimbriimonadia bacterium ATM]MBC6968882.1 hypothetical protein [Armatimonadota bacterium]